MSSEYDEGRPEGRPEYNLTHNDGKKRPSHNDPRVVKEGQWLEGGHRTSSFS